MDLRRPTELVLAHKMFKRTYESIFAVNFFRPSYAPILGFDDARWSLSREKMVLGVILDLIASGVVSADKLDLHGLIELPKIPFMEFSPRSSDPAPKRSRFSPDTSIEKQLESRPTEEVQPRPAWTEALMSLRDENDLGKAAVLEFLLNHHGDLSAHDLRAESDFKFVLWRLTSTALASCTFESPLASLGHKTKLDLDGLIDLPKAQYLA